MKRPSFTSIDLLLALVFVSIGATVLAFAINEFQRSQVASQTVYALVQTELALDQQLGDLKNYQDETTKLALRSGRLPPTLAFHFDVQVANGNRPVVIHPNETLMFDRVFKPCTTYPIGDCGYKLRLTLEQHPPAFSSSISSAFPEAALSLDRSDRTGFVIPKSYYRDPFQVVCDPRREIGLSGLVSSDKYNCLSRPQALCERGTLPKSIAVDPKSHALEFECGPQSKVVRCPAFYALNMVNTKTLDVGGGALMARCVRTTASVAFPRKQPEPALRMVGRACPAGYKSQSTCTLVNVKSSPGRCGSGVAQAVPGRLRFTQNKTQGSVDCGVDLQSQSCGAMWEGAAQLTIKCALDLPEFANAL